MFLNTHTHTQTHLEMQVELFGALVLSPPQSLLVLIHFLAGFLLHHPKDGDSKGESLFAAERGGVPKWVSFWFLFASLLTRL